MRRTRTLSEVDEGMRVLALREMLLGGRSGGWGPELKKASVLLPSSGVGGVGSSSIRRCKSSSDGPRISGLGSGETGYPTNSFQLRWLRTELDGCSETPLFAHGLTQRSSDWSADTGDDEANSLEA